jgi:hypothetical protein
MRQQRGIVASCRQPGGLSVLAHIEEANRDSAKSLGRGYGEHLAGRDRVSGKQQMAVSCLELKRVPYDSLGSLLTPSFRWHRRHVHHIGQLDALDLGPELIGD